MCTWLAEDDVLLKHAIEEGASLEVLAKGAVHFSQKFCLQEVHDRWHALLYNPDVSSQAQTYLPLDESDTPKEITSIRRKRKVGSLRNRYYQRLKRIRNDFLSSADLGLLTDRNDYHENGTVHDRPQVGNAGDCMPKPFGHQETDCDIDRQAFTQGVLEAVTNCVSIGGDTLHSEGPDPLVNNYSSETANNNCSSGFRTPNFPLSVLRSDGFPPSRSNHNGCDDTIPCDFEANSTGTGECLLLGEEKSYSNDYTMGLSPPLPSTPLWKTMEDLATPHLAVNMEIDVSCDNNKSKMAGNQNGDGFINSGSISYGDFVDLPDSLFDFPNDDYFNMNLDGKDEEDKSCFDNALTNEHIAIGDTDTPIANDDIDTLKVVEKAMMVANAAVATETEVMTSHLHINSSQEKPLSQVTIQMPSISTLTNKPFEPSEGPLYCPLNTEDPEIPCNDDIFLLIHSVVPYVSPDMTSITRNAMDPVERNNVQGVNSVEKTGLTQPQNPSLIFGPCMLPEIDQVDIGSGPTYRAEPTDTCKDLVPGHEAEELPLHTETGSVRTTHSKLVASPSISDQEGLESEIDDPNFSDIEAMILDMDLGSYEDDLQFTRQVSKYQQDNLKRTIIRLEQCARASIQRAMTCHGALAVFYGHHSKHFIRKTEVILGRSTEGNVVDIDLGKEGLNNKISRRQALLKMEDDGSFFLKNFAKNPILVNGVEVSNGEVVPLSSNCLIEIRRNSYVFESNQRYVRRYLINKKNQEQMQHFEWLPKEDGTIS